jgi:hypothetical protein
MASTTAALSTPTARAKSVVGSTITAAPVAAAGSETKTATEPPPSELSPPATATASEKVLIDFLERQILPYLSARRGDRLRLGNSRYSEDFFRLIKLRVAETYRARIEEIQAWCEERRMLDLQLKMQHWLHGWLFVHVPISFLLILLTAWHAYVTLFYY